MRRLPGAFALFVVGALVLSACATTAPTLSAEAVRARCPPRQSVSVGDGVALEYEESGPRDGVPLLLIMGLGAQLVAWDEGLIEQLVARGFRVIRYDNRDVGLSTKLHAAGKPNLTWLFVARALRLPVSVPYTLTDMADDAAGLLDALDIPAAHVVGMSMGGMIAQELALTRPERVLTLTSISSSTGAPDLPGPTDEAIAVLQREVPDTRAGAIESSVRSFQTIGGTTYPYDEDELRVRVAEAYDRCPYRDGFARQLAAVLAADSRRARLASLTVPTLVVHGDADPLVPVEAGLDTARAIPGAELLVLEGMGHQLPRPLWPPIVDAIATLAAKKSPAVRGGASAPAP